MCPVTVNLFFFFVWSYRFTHTNWGFIGFPSHQHGQSQSLMYTNGQWERSMYTWRGKNCATKQPLTHSPPPYKQLYTATTPSPSANYQVASSFQNTWHRIEVIKKGLQQDSTVWRKTKRQTKLYTVVQNDVKLQHQRAFKIYHLMPITQTNSK